MSDRPDERLDARLAAEVAQAQERERTLLANELHDGPVQVVAAALMRLELLEDAPADERQRRLDELRLELRTGYAQLRSLLVGLRPEAVALDGLADALRAQLERLGERTGIEAVLDDRLRSPARDERAVVAFRVVQEALANVRRHADASRVAVRLEDDGELAVEVRDDGRGFDPGAVRRAPGAGHVGLVTMRERVELAGGRFELRSRPGVGTTVCFRLPPRE